MTRLKQTLVIILLLTTSLVKGQLYEIPINVKIAKSSLIVEGKVIETQTYLQDGEIYTASLVRVQKILKGSAKPIDYVTIITLGGLYEGKEKAWSHLLQLYVEDKGIFFLQKTERPEIKDSRFPSPSYEVYSSGQGFIKYVEDGKEGLARDFVNVYPDRDAIFQHIQNAIGQAAIQVINSNETCIVVSIEQVENPPTSVDEVGFDVKIRTTENTAKLYKALVIVEYNTAFFGESIVNNGVLSFVESGISLSSNYVITATDLEDNVLKLELTFSGIPSQLYELTQNEVTIGSFYVSFSSPNGSPDLVFDNELMEQGNLYYDETTGRGLPFRCVEIENELFPPPCPQIDDFFPKTAAAGVGELSETGIPGVITIIGSDFGSPPPNSNVQKPNNYRVGFRNAGEGNFYVYPPARDYIKWTPDTIIVRVPSVGETGNAIEYAGTGKLVVVKTDETNCLDTSDVELYVPFCTRNSSFSLSGSYQSLFVKLANVNTEGGYDVFLENSFVNSISGGKEAFLRALNTWRCDPQYGVNVNFVVKEINDIIDFNTVCYVSFDTSIPAGVSVTTAAVTNIDPVDCSNTNHTFLPRWDMKFNKYYTNSSGTAIEIQWHTDSIPLPPNQDTLPNLNLEGVALHEIGHALLLRHVRNDDKVMKLADHRTSLTADDSNGGEHIVKLSASQPHCQTVLDPYKCPTTNHVTDLEGFEYLIYPNPVKDILHLEFERPIYSKICITNALGQLVYEQIISYDQKLQIDVSALEPGIYFTSLLDRQQNHLVSTTFKIIKI